jgi:hypothetical protein
METFCESVSLKWKTNDSSKKDPGYGSLAVSRARNMELRTTELPAGKFVINVLSPKTNTSANVIFAMEFRNALAQWDSEE